MKALIKEEQKEQEKKISISIDSPGYGFTPIKIIFTDDLGWVMKLGVFGADTLTSVELREIARKLDEYNKNMTNTKKWKQQTNSKNP